MKRLVVSIFFLSVIFFQAANPAAESDLSEKIIASVNLMGLENFAESANPAVRSFVQDVEERRSFLADINFNTPELICQKRFELCKDFDIHMYYQDFHRKYAHKSVSDMVKLDDNTFATASYDKTAKIWSCDPETSDWLIADLAGEHGHADILNCIVALNAYTVVTGSDDNCAKVWQRNVATNRWEWVADLLGHTRRIISLVVINDHTVATGSWDKTIKIWTCSLDGREWTLVQTLEKNDWRACGVKCIAALDENTLAVGQKYRGLIRIWSRKDRDSQWMHQSDLACYDLHSNAAIETIKRFNDEVFVATSDMDKNEIWCGWNSDENEWHIVARKPWSRIILFSRIFHQLVLNESTMVTCYDDGMLGVWTIPTLLEIALTLKLRSMSEAEKQEIYDELTAC